MNYELALKLREAGFPQMSRNIYHYRTMGEFEGVLCDCGPHWTISHFSKNGSMENTIAIPTLSELIEACGDNRPTLKPWNVFEWQASVTHPTLRLLILQGMGSTPEEAMANLYLELRNSS